MTAAIQESEIGVRVAKERAKRKITQQALADAAGLARTTISEYEYGRMPSAANILSIADAMELHLRWLITGKGKKYL